ncbi:olfactory receptor 5G26-like [Crassostrea virginica]
MSWNSSAPRDYMTIHDVNYKLVKEFWWNIAFCLLCLIFGIIGNSIVILVYHTKLKSKIEERFFIPILAFLDLLACAMVSALMLAKSFYPAKFQDEYACKVLTYFGFSTSSMALFMLAVIAFHRFQKIVRPFGYQLSLRAKQYIILVIGVISYVLFSPVFYVYGIKDIPDPDTNLTYYICSAPSKGIPKRSMFVFQGILICIYLISIIAMAIMYFFVARTLRMRIKASRKRKEIHSSQTLHSAVIVRMDGCAKANNAEAMSKEKQIEKLMNAPTITDTYDTLQLRRKSCHKRKGHFSLYRYSYIFMIITIKATLSYIVPWILVIVKSNDKSPWTELNQRLFILRYLYILSHITNPVIYGLLDKTFRKHLRTGLCEIRAQQYVMNGSGSN